MSNSGDFTLNSGCLTLKVGLLVLGFVHCLKCSLGQNSIASIGLNPGWSGNSAAMAQVNDFERWPRGNTGVSINGNLDSPDLG